jgi:hypothetical protein
MVISGYAWIEPFPHSDIFGAVATVFAQEATAAAGIGLAKAERAFLYSRLAPRDIAGGCSLSNRCLRA